jgi:hypothetical protein
MQIVIQRDFLLGFASIGSPNSNEPHCASYVSYKSQCPSTTCVFPQETGLNP